MYKNRLLPLLLLATSSPAFATEIPAEYSLASLMTEVPADGPGDGPAVAADDDEDSPEDSVKSETDAVKRGAATSADDLLGDDDKKKRVIMTLQKKNFMKLGRVEFGPSLGFVANDPFLKRYIIGGIFDYHFTEIFGLDIQVNYSPELGAGVEDPTEDRDLKQLTQDLLKYNSVSPDISKLTAHGSAGLTFSPIYGKAAVGRQIIAFDMFGTFGLGATQTHDDLAALGDVETTVEDNGVQVHPTTIIGGGARVAFSQGFGIRVETKSMTYIERISGTTLEMKNNLIVQGSASFFFPNMK